MKKWMVAVLAVLAAAPAAAQGREGRERIQVGPRTFTFAFTRGRIGVVVKTDADAQADKVGARVEAVTPGGPADQAGLKAGDIITRFNGVALGGAETADEDESGPGHKLVRLARALDPGDSVRVEYRRGDETRTITVVAAEVENTMDMAVAPRVRVAPPAVGPDPEHPFPDFMVWGGSPWFDLELASLNPELGEYFGTQEGVLVVKSPRDETLGLKGGDVILAIDGRSPTSPGHAMRILRSYAAGESVKIDILRQQKRQTVTWKVPERGGRMERMFRRLPGERMLEERRGRRSET